MSVVEREAPLAEGLESVSGEPAAPLKVARGAIASMANGKGAKPVLYREPRAATGAEVRAYIAARSDALQQFVAPLEEALRKAAKLRVAPLSSSRKASRKVADLVLGVVRRIAHRETGVYSMEPNVALLSSALYAGSVEGAIISGLVRRAQEAQDVAEAAALGGDPRRPMAAAAPLIEYDLSRELDELTMLLKWYVKRKMSLTGLEVHHSRGLDVSPSEGAQPSGEEDDALFALEVMHDHQVFAAKGCFVSCGLRLVGHDGQPLWLRVSARWDGQPVAARPAWSSWTDPGGDGAVEVLGERQPFCSLVPIRPNAQRIIIDDIRAFVPYAALDLPPGRCDIELHVAVIDNEGREVLSASRPESICIPGREAGAPAVPAPHSAGMWPHDVVSGDRLSDLRISSGHKVVAGWERHTVSAQFDLSLFMHAGESVLLECRFLDAKGNVVELSSLGIPYVASELDGPAELVSSYRYRRVLHPRGAWAHYRALCVDIPVEFLLLDPGSHALTCEIVAVSSDDRVLCGDIGLVSVQVPGRGAPSAAAPGVELHTLQVDPSWRFGDEEGVRIEASLAPKDASRQIADLASGRVGELFAPYRVEISIEREDGHLLLQAFSDSLGMGFKPVTRGVCVEGSAGLSHHVVVANFRKDEILGWSLGPDGARGASKVPLVARVRALSLAGEELLSHSREFFVRPSPAGEPKIVEAGGAAPMLADVTATALPQGSRLSCRVVVNVPRGRLAEQGLYLSCAVQASGKRVAEALKQRIAPHQRAAWARQQVGLTQFVCEFECDTQGHQVGELSLVAALASPSGEELQSVSQPARTAGVLLDGEGPDSVRDGEPEDGSAAEPEADPAPRRGILSWFKS